MTVSYSGLGVLDERPRRKNKSDVPRPCARCKKTFVPLSGRLRKYCYDPECEEARERAHTAFVTKYVKVTYRARLRARHRNT